MTQNLKFSQLFKEHTGKVSDKWSLYLEEWDRILLPYQGLPLNLLEIGIQNGGSLEIWSSYFLNAKSIVGCDINPDCRDLRFEDPRIAVVIGDVNSEECKQQILQQAKTFDVIVDDGSHRSSDIVRSFIKYFDHLNDGGIYLIEDLHCSYWKDFEGGLYSPLSAMAFFKRLADVINFEHWRNNKPRTSVLNEFIRNLGVRADEFLFARLHSIEFLNSLCVIRKASPDKNILGNRIVVGMDERVTTGSKRGNGTGIHDVTANTEDDSKLDVFELMKSVESYEEEFAEQRQQIEALKTKVVDLQQGKAMLMAQVAELQHHTGVLAAQLTEQIQQTLTFQTQLAEQGKLAKGLQDKLAEKEQSFQELSSKLWEIYGSTAWKIILLMWKIRLFLAPNGSKRERLGHSLSRLVHNKRSNDKKQLNVDNSQEQQDGIKTRCRKLEENVHGKIYSYMLSIARGEKGIEYVDISDTDLSKSSLPVKIIAFYLPQFHPIPENDLWWGRGFTEWTNASKAIPQFVGHYQPHLPGELGFYDLRSPEVQRRQVELAKKYGLYGFCFHYYWFSGKRLLERPLDQFLADPEIDFPFCICWANENWTRRWDGLEHEILIAQEHSEESDLAFIKDVAPVLRHERYIRINGRPLLVVYRVQLMPDPIATARRWREYCLSEGIGNPYLVAVQSFGFTDPISVGFDATVEFPPHNVAVSEITQNAILLNPEYEGKIYSYQELAKNMANSNKDAPYPVFKTVSPGWDNEPRRPGKGTTFAFSTPDVYKDWLIKSCQYTKQKFSQEVGFVFVNAWNEWGEGAHLEPDRKFGYAYLQATADALLAVEKHEVIPLNNIRKEHDTAIILHIYYVELWEEIKTYLNNLGEEFDLFVSIPFDVDFSADQIRENFPNAHVFRCENRGRDIAPFIRIFSAIYPLNYKYICKIHTKKSAHREDGQVWRVDVINKLLGSKREIGNIKKHLDESDIGIIGPEGHLLSTDYFGGETEALINDLAKALNLSYDGNDFPFFAGSMFWFRPSVISSILDLNLTEDDFPIERGQRDGTLAHALERVICLVAHEKGYRLVQTGTFSDVPVRPENYPFASPIPKEYYRNNSD